MDQYAMFRGPKVEELVMLTPYIGLDWMAGIGFLHPQPGLTLLIECVIWMTGFEKILLESMFSQGPYWFLESAIKNG